MTDDLTALRKRARGYQKQGWLTHTVRMDDYLALMDRLERAEAAEATLERVRATVEAEKHYTEECGWDVPVIRVLAALAPVTEEGDKE